MVSLIPESLCCGGEFCCNLLCGFCMRICETSRSQHFRMAFLSLYILGCLFGLLFLFYGGTLMDPFRLFIGTAHPDCGSNGACLGIQTNYRLSLSYLVFHLVMIVGSATSKRLSQILNGTTQTEGCWLLKVICIGAFFVIALMIPNDFFDFYRELSRVASSVYLMLQLVIVIDFAYAWSNNWVERLEHDPDSDQWMFWMFFFSGAMWIGALTTTVLNYYWFSTTSGCPINVAIITVSLVLGIVFTLYSLSAMVESGSLLTSSAVNLYCVFLCWDALVSEPDSGCNDWTDTKSTVMVVVITLGVTVCVVLYVMFQKKRRMPRTPILEKIANLILAKEEDDDTEAERNRSLVYFHLFMALLSLYMGMMLTNWGGAMIIGSGGLEK